MSARSAMSSIDALWKPTSAKTSPATASICSSRTARGTRRVPARRFGLPTEPSLLASRFGRASSPVELAAERLLDALAHHHAKDGLHRVGRKRPQALERLAHLRPALGRASR